MYTYFKFDGTQTINGAAPEQIVKAFGLKKGKTLYFIKKDGKIIYHFVGDENGVKAMIADLENPKEAVMRSMKLKDAKQFKIAESKDQLAEYLKSHPLKSAVHGRKDKFYSVTAEKQAQLTSVLLMSTAAKQDGTQYDISWNASGKPCEVWTLKELTKLAYEINAYVKPLVAEQQFIEMAVNNCKSVEEVSAVNINYENCTYSV